ncbi:MAG: hypothetical protein PHP44_06395 [Kiritimatiellae bacterium]|nr:hypothetical protein [Kiritimatiellia bacterium]MDD4735717.1 hypothetical protein [Kiritimatiellia bacterium]
MKNLLLLLRIRRQSLAHARDSLRNESAFKIIFVASFGSGLIAGLWWLFLAGFAFMNNLGGVGMIVVPKLFAFFFLSLTFMLILSGMLTTYSTLYRSDEMPHLLLHPFSISEILVFKSLESAFLSSWAFFFIILPFVGAYARHQHLPWHFCLGTLVFSIPFALVCSAIGSILTILFIRWIPRSRFFWTVLLLALFGGVLWWWTHRIPVRYTQEDTVLMLNQFVPFLALSTSPVQPGAWITEGITALSRGHWARGILYFLFLWANALLAMLLIETLGRRFFYTGWQRTLSVSHASRSTSGLAPPMRSIPPFCLLPPDIRALMIKDIRTFLREPQQWMQAVFFFGLLAVYFFSLGNMHYRSLPPVWKNIITFLNIFSIACVLTSLSSRFIYPQMSLEGQAFWIIGMAPTTLWRVLTAKFLLSFLTMLLISAGLMTISTSMLDVPLSTRLVSLYISFCISLAMAGLSTGTGAIFIDLKQRNPSAIVSGFGGTLNLVLSLAVMLACILPVATVFHYREMGLFHYSFFRFFALAGILLPGLLAPLTALIPLRLGRRRLMRLDY